MQELYLEKPTLVQLLNRHQINMIRLARATGISLRIVRAMARNVPVQPIVAEAVLHGVYRLTGFFYQLEDVAITLLPSSYVIGSIQSEGSPALAMDGKR